MSNRVPVFAANWKMNKALSEVEGYVAQLSERLAPLTQKAGKDYQLMVAPSAVHLPFLVKAARGSAVECCAQNCGTEKSGAFTGEVSPVVLKEVGCSWVLVGHSERRHVFGESNDLVGRRLKAALQEGLKVILCVGEKIEERRSNRTFDVVSSHLSVINRVVSDTMWPNLVVAYEPVWAIGTGETATPEQAQEVHAFIRRWLVQQGWNQPASALRILYGGSVNPGNSESLMAKEDVDGLLVGGASLDPVKFAELVTNGLKACV